MALNVFIDPECPDAGSDICTEAFRIRTSCNFRLESVSAALITIFADRG